LQTIRLELGKKGISKTYWILLKKENENKNKNKNKNKKEKESEQEIKLEKVRSLSSGNHCKRRKTNFCFRTIDLIDS
jgi:hypothetical protein